MPFKKCLIIEIIGPPGAGKTTLGESIVSSLNSKGIESNFVKKIQKKYYKNNFDIITYAKLLKSLLYFLYLATRLNFRKNKFNFSSWKKTFFSAIKVSINNHSLVNSCGKSISIIEPGHLMLLLNGCMYREDVMPKKLLNKFLSYVKSVDIVIYINIDVITAMNRISSRERGEPQRMSSSNEVEKKRTIELCNLNSKNIVNFFQNKEVSVFEINGKKSVSDNVLQITNFLKINEKI